MKKLFIALLFILTSPALASKLGDDGLHKPSWLQTTFKDMAEDLAEANDQGKRMFIIIEQRGCIYCTRMHEQVFTQPHIKKLIQDHFYVVQINMFGDEDVTDFDGVTLPEKEMIRRWNVAFTPTLIFLPDIIPQTGTVSQNAIMTLPGAFGKETTFNLLNFVLEKRYEGDEHFQKYHARKYKERQATQEQK